MERLAADCRRQDRFAGGTYLQWKAVLVSDGEVSGVGVNYLPVNSAPVVDDLMVVPGARLPRRSSRQASRGR
jgi:hypothetical protein